MADLKIFINPTGASALGTGAATSPYVNNGSIVFDEVAKLIYVRGIGYGLTDAQAQAISDATTAIGTIQGTGAGSFQKAINDVLGGVLDATGVSTLKDVIDGLETTLAGQNTTISGLSDAISTGIQSLRTDLDALATGVATGIQGLQGQITNLAGNAIQSINGLTGTSVTINGNDIQWNSGATGIAGSIQEKLSDIQNALDTLGGTGGANLDSVLAKIKNIEDELEVNEATGSSALSTIIDSLRNLKIKTNEYSGINTDGTAGPTGAVIGLQTSLNNLKNYVDSLSSNYDESGAASTAQTNAQTYTDGKIQELDATISATGTYVSVQVIEEDGVLKGITIGENNIASASTLSTVQTTADNALPKGDSGYANAAALATGVKSDLIGATGAASNTNTINGAKKYAEEKASEVVSWTVIGS